MKFEQLDTGPGLVRRRVAAGATAAFLGLAAALGSGLMATAPARRAPPRPHRHRPRRRRQRVAARRDLVLLGRHRAEGPGRADRRSSSTASSRPSAVTFAATVAANTVNGGFNGHATITACRRTPRTPTASAPRATGPRRTPSRPRTSRATSTSCSSATRRSARPATWRRTAPAGQDTLNVATRRQPERRAAGVRRRPGRDRQHRGAVERVPRARQAAPVPVGRHHRQPRRRRQGLRAALLDPEHRPLGAVLQRATRRTQSGGDYWYIYKDVLFIDLNSNSYVTARRRRRRGAHRVRHRRRQRSTAPRPSTRCSSTTTRSTRRPTTPTTATTSSAARTSRPRSPNLGVDLVLQGHDHSYSRSYVIKNGAEGEPGRAARRRRGVPGPGRRHLRDGATPRRARSTTTSPKPDSTGTGDPGNGPDPLNPEQLLGQLGREPGARPHLRQGPGARRQARRREHPQRHLRGAERRGRARQRLGAPTPPTASRSARSSTRSPCTRTTVTARPSRSTCRTRLRASSAGRSTATTAWSTSVPRRSATATYFEATGKINPILVSDSRRSLAPWSISANVGDFQDADKTFSGSYLGWTPYVLDGGAGAEAGAAVPSVLRRPGQGPVGLRGLGCRRAGPPAGRRQARRRPGPEDPGQRREGQLPRHPHDHRAEQLTGPFQLAG